MKYGVTGSVRVRVKYRVMINYADFSLLIHG